MSRSNIGDIHLAFDVGHSSIGWAVLQTSGEVEVKGCGAVIFRADDCLVSARRTCRRQRRHIRSTRQRIARLKLLFKHLGVLNDDQLNRPGCGWPWKLAARVLMAGNTLTWSELWDVLRWYAHNRGYDANRRWSAAEADADKAVAAQLGSTKTLLDRHGVKTMAETFCKELGVDPLGAKSSSLTRFKGLKAVFPRGVVEAEVARILQSHVGELPGVDEKFATALFSDWRAIPCPDIQLPRRYQGGLLFGQLVPRFDNRIISSCPITGQKVPSRNTPEFLNFRWGMLLANVRVARVGERKLKPLTVAERKELDRNVRHKGVMSSKQFTDAVEHVTGAVRHNLATMLMDPDAKEALVVDPVQKLVTTGHVGTLWATLPERIQKRARGQLRHGKTVRLGELGNGVPSFEAEVLAIVDKAARKGRQKDKTLSVAELLAQVLQVPKLDGRAAYARPTLCQAFAEVMAGRDPKEEGGCLFVTEKLRQAQLCRSLAKQTNNHLVRHRLLILGRLLCDIIKEYADGDQARIGQIAIEVNRELREMSGKTAKEVAQDLGRRLANIKYVIRKLEADGDFMGELGRRGLRHIPPGIIRKARIAEDLGWTCPYTGLEYEPIDLLTRRVDTDHIVPRSDRAVDSLDSLVITFSAVNAMKGSRTALQFVIEEQGKPVADLPSLSIVGRERYEEFVGGLETFQGHSVDQKRKKRRKALMLLPSYEERDHTPRDLTVTSQLARLGAQTLQHEFADLKETPVIVSLPDIITGEVRKAWNVTDCLSLACPQVLDEFGIPKPKNEIRNISHLHHALDACVLGLASHFIPNNRRVWELIAKRTLTPAELRELQAVGVVSANAHGRVQLQDLAPERKEQIRQCLAEKRIVQYIPKRLSGLHVEQNTWRVLTVENGKAILEQEGARRPDGTRPPKKKSTERTTKLIGLEPGKLHALKGALIIGDNFGVALDPTPLIIPFHKVWPRLAELRKKNGGKWPRVLRNGQIIRVPKGRYEGTWRVFSAKATLTLDLGAPDVVRMESTGERQKREVQLTTLLKDGMTILHTPLTGVACVPVHPKRA